MFPNKGNTSPSKPLLLAIPFLLRNYSHLKIFWSCSHRFCQYFFNIPRLPLPSIVFEFLQQPATPPLWHTSSSPTCQFCMLCQNPCFLLSMNSVSTCSLLLQCSSSMSVRWSLLNFTPRYDFSFKGTFIMPKIPKSFFIPAFGLFHPSSQFEPFVVAV